MLAAPAMSDEQAQSLAEWGSAAVRAEVGQQINVIESDTVTLDGTDSGLVLLPELEVRAVSAVVEDGVELEAEHDYTWDRSGCLWRIWGPGWRWTPLYGWRHQLGRWTAWPRSVTVTYSHGWAPPSPQWDVARQVALEVAGRAYRNPEGMQLQSERIGDWSRSWMPTGTQTGQISDAAKRSLDLLRPGRR